MEKLFWVTAVTGLVSGLLSGGLAGWYVTRTPRHIARVRAVLGRRDKR